MKRAHRLVPAVVRRFVRNETAGPIVEFAVVAPVLMLILGGIIDFSRAFTQRSNLVSAVREGARFAAVQEDVCTRAAAIRTRVVDRFSAFTGLALQPEQVTVEFLDEANAAACTSALPAPSKIRVRVPSYPFRAIVPLPAIVGDGIALSADATFRWERVD